MKALATSQQFHGVRFDGKTYDCGAKLGFLAANVAFALADPELAPLLKTELSKILREPLIWRRRFTTPIANWRRNHAGSVPSVLSPQATTRSISSGSGVCNATASSTGPVSQVSQSPAAVKSTGMAFA